jgi:chaperonin GroEL
MGKQIRFDDAARESLRRGVEQLATAVRVTLGPRGRNVVIDHGSGVPTITNDGLTIAREIELANPFENLGVQLLREVALKTGETAGDGTTTATVLAGSVVCHGLTALAAGHNPMAVKRGIDRAVQVVVDELRRQSRAISSRVDVARVAAVSAQQDGNIGELIADAMDRVGFQGVITVGEGRSTRTSLVVVEGTRLDQGYLSPYFVTDAERMEAVLENVYVLIADMRITEARDVVVALELAANAGRPLLVVAEDVEGEALATLVVNRLRGTVASVAVRAPHSGVRRRQALEDLAVLTGGRLFAPDLGTRLDRFTADDFGRVRGVQVDSDHTLLTEGGGDAAVIRDRIARLRREARDEATPFDREWFEQRRARLAGGIAVVTVGAPTQAEMLHRKAMIEDALAATRSAVEEGVIPGGGVALLRAQPALRSITVQGDERAGVQIIMRALEEPALRIAENAGEDGPRILEHIRTAAGPVGFDAEARTICDLEQRGILDPLKVTRCALQNAASIGALVLTTDAIVVDSPESRDEPPAED